MARALNEMLFIYLKSPFLLTLDDNQGIMNSQPRQGCAAMMSTEHDTEVEESPSEAEWSGQTPICYERLNGGPGGRDRRRLSLHILYV